MLLRRQDGGQGHGFPLPCAISIKVQHRCAFDPKKARDLRGGRAKSPRRWAEVCSRYMEGKSVRATTFPIVRQDLFGCKKGEAREWILHSALKRAQKRLRFRPKLPIKAAVRRLLVPLPN